MFRRSVVCAFYAQRSVPIFPQVPSVCSDLDISVGHLFIRDPVVKPDLHPLEQDFGQLLEREHDRYNKHQGQDGPGFLLDRGCTIDNWKRHDAKVIEANFFNSNGYQESLKSTAERYSPSKRVTVHDLFDPFSRLAKRPARLAMNRALTETLILLVKDSKVSDGKLWTVPLVTRSEKESLRSTADRLLDELSVSLHDDVYTSSNSPAAVFEAEGGSHKNFLFVSNFMGGTAAFTKSGGLGARYGASPMKGDEEAQEGEGEAEGMYTWVTRTELEKDYAADEFATKDLKDLILDIAP